MGGEYLADLAWDSSSRDDALGREMRAHNVAGGRSDLQFCQGPGDVDSLVPPQCAIDHRIATGAQRQAKLGDGAVQPTPPGRSYRKPVARITQSDMIAPVSPARHSRICPGWV